MIRPLDMQVAMHALPEIAKQTSADAAGVLYKQVQELGRARQEQLRGQERIEQTREGTDANFRGVESGANPPIGRKREGLSDRERRESQRDRPYMSGGIRLFQRAVMEEGAGHNLDIVA